jgi:hypothetical protein
MGKFRIVLDTDDDELGGYNRIDKNAVYLSFKKSERHLINSPVYLYLYLPSRTALVFRREAMKKATDI